MTPLVRRSWALVGQTPVLRHRGAHREKISSIGALSISPRRRRVNLYMHLYPARSVTEDEVMAFLQHLLRHLRGQVLVLWDRLNQHRSRYVRAYVVSRQRLELEYLPAYAPELNPVESVWCHLKHHRLANHGIFELAPLQAQVVAEARRLRSQESMLRSFIREALPMKL